MVAVQHGQGDAAHRVHAAGAAARRRLERATLRCLGSACSADAQRLGVARRVAGCIAAVALLAAQCPAQGGAAACWALQLLQRRRRFGTGAARLRLLALGVGHAAS